MAKSIMERLVQDGAGFGRDNGAQLLDLTQGGQNGWMTDPANYVSNASYVKRNIIPVLLQAPAGFQDLPNPELWVGTLKALVEEHAKTIEGLNSTLTVEFVENPVGQAGEMQEDVSNVVRSRSTPAFVWPEKYGKVIQRFVTQWIINLLGDPETKVPAIVSVDGKRDAATLLPEYTSMTVLFIEPDPTHTKVLDAWLCANMLPKGAGDRTGKRDVTAGGEQTDLNIEFTAITQVGKAVEELAQKILNEMNLTGMNPDARTGLLVEGVAADIEAAQGAGYMPESA